MAVPGWRKLRAFGRSRAGQARRKNTQAPGEETRQTGMTRDYLVFERQAENYLRAEKLTRSRRRRARTSERMEPARNERRSLASNT